MARDDIGTPGMIRTVKSYPGGNMDNDEHADDELDEWLRRFDTIADEIDWDLLDVTMDMFDDE